MSNSDERAAKSLIERVLMEAEDEQLQNLVIEAIDVLIALHEVRGWPRNELENRVSEELTSCFRPDGPKTTGKRSRLSRSRLPAIRVGCHFVST